MRLQRPIQLKIWLTSCACLAVAILSFFGAFHNYELLSYDIRFRLRQPQKISADIVVIEISDDTLKNLGSWPLPRDFHASLLDVLSGLQAKMVIFDIIFSEPGPYDNAFSLSIKNAGNVYLPLAFYIDQKAKKGLFPKSDTILADISTTVKTHIKAQGHINVFVDSDGKIRRVPMFINYQNALVPQLGFKAACDWLGLDTKNIKFKGSRLIIDRRLSIPISADGSLIVNYPDRWSSSFKHVSYFEILKSYGQIKNGIQPEMDLSVIKDKVCFIGLTAVGTCDLKPTPLENIYPALGLQASIFNSVINKDFIIDASRLINTLINIFILILSIIICLSLSPLRSFFGNIVLAIAYILIAAAIFIFLGIWIDLFLPLLIIAITYVAITSYRFFNEAKKRQILEKELEIARTIQKSFLPEEIKQFHGFEISSFIQPAKFVAGDLYDILAIDDKRIGIFIGDVSGKGVPASLIMAQTISLFRVFARQYSACPEVLARLNKELYGRFSGRFVTCMYMIIDTETNEVRVSSAGQEPLVFYKKNSSELSEPDLSGGLPLGILEEPDYNEVKFNIASGDKIIIFTDGLFEARNIRKKEFGLDNVRAAILENVGLSSSELSEAVREKVFSFSHSAKQYDDITLIAVAKQ